MGYFEQPTLLADSAGSCRFYATFVRERGKTSTADVDGVHCMKQERDSQVLQHEKKYSSWPAEKARTAEEKEPWRGGPEQAQNQFSLRASRTLFLSSSHIS